MVRGVLEPERAPIIIRQALLDRLAAERAAVVEAAAGYGKTTLARQWCDRFAGASVFVRLSGADSGVGALVAALRRAVRVAGLSDLVAAIDPTAPAESADRLLDALAGVPEAVLFVFDDVHELGADAAALAMLIAAALPGRHQALVAGRRVPSDGGIPMRLTSADLAFTAEELAELLARRSGSRPSAAAVRAAAAASDGWPTLAMLLPAAAVDGAAGDARSLLDDLVNGMLTRLDDADRRATIRLAHLAPFSAPVADVVAGGTGAVDRLIRLGLPLFAGTGGDWDMPGPVAACLRSAGPLPASVARAVAGPLVAERRGHAAARLLLDVGEPAAAADLMAGLAPDAADDIGVEALADLAERLPDPVVGQRPSVLLRIVQMGDTDSAGVRGRVIWRLDRILGSTGDRKARRELDAERARDLIWDEKTRPRAAALAARVLDAAGPDEIVARARALDVAGRCASWYLPYQPSAAAGPMLEESARLAVLLGRPVWAVQALVPLAMGVYAAGSHFDAALATLRRALEHLPFRSRTRATVLSFQADLLAALGRFDEGLAVVTEMREIADGRDERILAYASWSEAILASFARDRDACVRAVLDVERHRGSWFDREAGAEFLAHAAYLLDRIGEASLARHYLQRARERGGSTATVTRIFQAQIAARSGDPVEAEELITAVLAGGTVEPRDRPYLMLMRAFAATRRGDPAAPDLAYAACDALLAVGDLHTAWLREPSVIVELLPLASGSAGGIALARMRGHLRVQTFGRFRIHLDGVPVRLPAGLPEVAVRVVVAHGGRMRAEALIEALWPDAAPDPGRNRLRNLLSRVRAEGGDVLVRDGEMIRLPANSQIDTEEFRQRVASALAADSGTDAGSQARSAMALYRGDFLPDDLDGWADEPRRRYRREYLAMLDIAAAAARRLGEIDEAIRLIERAIEAEPLDESRYLDLADLLSSQGRRGSARAALRRAATALAGIDAAPSEALQRRLAAG